MQLVTSLTDFSLVHLRNTSQLTSLSHNFSCRLPSFLYSSLLLVAIPFRLLYNIDDGDVSLNNIPTITTTTPHHHLSKHVLLVGPIVAVAMVIDIIFGGQKHTPKLLQTIQMITVNGIKITNFWNSRIDSRKNLLPTLYLCHTSKVGYLIYIQSFSPIYSSVLFLF